MYNPKDHNTSHNRGSSTGDGGGSGEPKDNDGTNRHEYRANHHHYHHPLHHATACADSIYKTLTEIAMGGSQALQEIQQLEQEKDAIEAKAACIAMALALQQAEAQMNAAWQNHDFATAAKAFQPWLQWKLQQQQAHAKDQTAVNHKDEPDEQMKQNKRVVTCSITEWPRPMVM